MFLDERVWHKQIGIVIVDSERNRKEKCCRPSVSRKAGLDTYLSTSFRGREVGRYVRYTRKCTHIGTRRKHVGHTSLEPRAEQLAVVVKQRQCHRIPFIRATNETSPTNETILRSFCQLTLVGMSHQLATFLSLVVFHSVDLQTNHFRDPLNETQLMKEKAAN